MDFKIYSKRWGHDDIIKIEKTDQGWHVDFLTISGECNKRGEPYLLENLDHDNISYPNNLGHYLERLWEKSSAMAPREIQDAISQLADWTTSTEKNSPDSQAWAEV